MENANILRQLNANVFVFMEFVNTDCFIFKIKYM